MVISGSTGDFKVLCSGYEVGDVISVSKPDVEMSTTEIKGSGIMGAINIPNSYGVNPMSLTIAIRKSGKNKHHLMASGELKIEIRIASDIRLSSGEIVVEGTKLFATGFFVKHSGGKVENGAIQDETYDFSVYRYREIIDGNEVVLIDQINNIFKVGGSDRASDVRNILG